MQPVEQLLLQRRLQVVQRIGFPLAARVGRQSHVVAQSDPTVETTQAAEIVFSGDRSIMRSHPVEHLERIDGRDVVVIRRRGVPSLRFEITTTGVRFLDGLMARGMPLSVTKRTVMEDLYFPTMSAWLMELRVQTVRSLREDPQAFVRCRRCEGQRAGSQRRGAYF